MRCYRWLVIASADVTIRRISPDDGPILRELRLRSLADAPDAFGQPLEEARRRPMREWERSARQAARGVDRTWLIAECDAGAVGLVQGRRRRPGTLLVFSDGVPETENAAREFYSEGPMQEFLKRMGNASAAALGEGLLEDVETFRGEQPPTDDLTLLILRRH